MLRLLCITGKYTGINKRPLYGVLWLLEACSSLPLCVVAAPGTTGGGKAGAAGIYQGKKKSLQADPWRHKKTGRGGPVLVICIFLQARK